MALEPPSWTSPTDRFLLDCLRLEGQPEAAPEIDWPTLVERAQRNGVAPLLYRRLREMPPIPPAALEPLRQAYYQNAAANTLRYRELGQVLSALEAASIPAIVLKGPALALTIYPDPALRVIGDLDLLVRREQVEQAMAALQSLGYGPPEHEPPYPFEYLARFGRHLQLQRRDRTGTLDLEVHWTLIGELWAGAVTAIDVEGLWVRATPLQGEGWRACQLSPADMLLHLALHATLMHGFTELGLRIYVDVDRLVRHHTSGKEVGAFWAQVIALARAQRLATILYTTLMLARDLLGTPLPASVLAALRPGAVQQRIFAQALQADDILRQRRLFAGPGKWRMRLMLLDRWRDGARALGLIVLGGRGWQALRDRAPFRR
jgi:hypothetical protein